MSNTAIDYLSDKIDELNQQQKRYRNAFEYLVRRAREELEKDDLNIETEILALEILKVFEDTQNYKFKL